MHFYQAEANLEVLLAWGIRGGNRAILKLDWRCAEVAPFIASKLSNDSRKQLQTFWKQPSLFGWYDDSRGRFDGLSQRKQHGLEAAGP